VSGTILLIAGPSGSGKTTLARALVNRVPFLTKATTVTTRAPRPGEVPGEDYHFVSPERFAELKRADALIECAETYTECYGIPRSVLAGVCDRALILTGGGALSLRRRLQNSFSIFIQPASATMAAARILGRNCPNSEFRIGAFEQEMALAPEFDRIFLNVDFTETLDQIEDFYLSARRQRTHGRAPKSFPDSGRGTAAGPVLCAPRLQAETKAGSPCHNCIQGNLGLIADVYPRWFRPYKAIEVAGIGGRRKYCARAALLGQDNLHPVMVPNAAVGPQPLPVVAGTKQIRRRA
jgi:guanylate kinase